MNANATVPQFFSQERARQRLLNEVGRRWAAGTRLPPVRDLARLLGTGQTNTFRAVKQLVGEGVLIARPSLGTYVHPGFVSGTTAGEVAPHPAPAGPDLRGQVVHLFIGDVGDAFMMPAVMLLDRELATRGARTHIVRTNLQNQTRLLAEAAGANAAVLCNPDTALELEAAPPLLLVLSTAQSLRPFRETGYDLVSVDSRHGAFRAGRHVRSLGVPRVAFLGCTPGTGYDALSALRLESFEHGLGAPVQPAYQLTAPHYFQAAGADAFDHFLTLTPRPDVVFCASDDLAVGFAYGAARRGQSAGHDVQLIGFDGQLGGRNLPCGPLTTIEVPVIEMAHVGLELLTRRFAQPERPVRQMLVGCELYQGATTRPQMPRSSS